MVEEQKPEEYGYNQEESKTYKWGSELEEVTKTNDSNYFKPEKGETRTIKVNTSKNPVEKFITFDENDGPKRRFEIEIFERSKDEVGNTVWNDAKIWSIAPMFLHKINNYINRTTVFEVTKNEKGFDVSPLGLPVE